MRASPMQFVRALDGAVQFRIPIYQRKYSWEKKECKRLFDDILEAGKNIDSESHFFGSIVYTSLQHHSASVQEMVVIDGQQRLTSVMLLLSAYCRAIENKALKNISTEAIKGKYLVNTFEKDEERQQKLILTKADAETFKMVLDGGDINNIVAPSKNILDNFAYFQKRIKNLDDDELESLYQGIGKLTHVDIVLTEGQDNPQVIFDSLNSTGKDLTEADKIRNLLLMGLGNEEQTRLYTEFWSPMEKRITARDDDEFDEFMQDFLTVKQTQIPIKKEVYTKYKEYFLEKDRDNAACVEELNYFSKLYSTIAIGTAEDDEIKEALWFLNKLRVTVSYPFLLQVFADLEKQIILKEDILEILELIQSYIFRRQICGGLTSGHGDFFAKLYDQIEKDDRQKYVESTKAGFQSLEGKYRLPSDDDFTKHLLIADMYQGKVKDYPLLKMENFSRTKEKVGILNFPTVTIEHILPQNPNLSEDWQKELGENWKEIQRLDINRLGNLTITQLNSELSDLPFKIKKEKAFNNTIYKLSEDLKNFERWDRDAIEERTQNMTKLALDVWKHPKLSDEIMKKYRDDENEEEMDPEPDESWESIRKMANPKAIELQDEVIKQVVEKFDCYYEPEKTALKFYTKERKQFRDLFMVMSGRKTICRIAFRIDPSTYEDKHENKIDKVKGWWFRHEVKDPKRNERRMRVNEDDIPLVLEQLEHAYNVTKNELNYR